MRKKPIKEKIIIECKVCKKMFLIYDCFKNIRKYCSNYCKYKSTERKEKIGLSNKGKKHSLEFRNNCKKRMLGNILSEITKEKMSKTHLAKWENRIRKGKTYFHQANNRKYRKWRMEVFKRDDYTCQSCFKKGIYLEAHHIKGWTEYPDLRYEKDNGLTLCKKCHILTRKK